MSSFNSLEVFKSPKCLISTSRDGRFQVHEDVLGEIRQIHAPLVVVAIVGLYRTGKSYLMNRLAGKTNGFPLGHTTEAETKGIWVWCRVHPNDNNRVLLLLDTEGLGDISKGDNNHDNRIFVLATLLCNALVYNIMTAFNQEAIEKLTLVSEISKKIQFENKLFKQTGNDQLHLILPTFVLCVRDFSLDFSHDGEQVSADEYLENSLKAKSGTDERTKQYNRTRNCIRIYFPSRKCFAFDRPGGRNVMRNLEKTSLTDLSKDFLQDTEIFLDYMFKLKPKTLMHSKSVNGSMFATLAECFVKAIREDAVPDVDDAFKTVANIENERMTKVAIQVFKQRLESIEMPVMDIQAFNGLYEDAKRVSLKKLRNESVFNSKPFEEKALLHMETIWNKKKQDNLQMVQECCRQRLEEMYKSTVGRNVQMKTYMKPGGYQQYKSDIKRFKSQFISSMTAVDQSLVQQTWFQFSEKESSNEMEIMMRDKALTDKERERETQRMKKEYQQLREESNAIVREVERNERARTEEFERNRKRDQEDHKRELEKVSQSIISAQNEARRAADMKIALKEQRNIDQKRFEELEGKYERHMKSSAQQLDEMEKKCKENIERVKAEKKDLKKKIETKNEETKEQKENGFFGTLGKGAGAVVDTVVGYIVNKFTGGVF